MFAPRIDWADAPQAGAKSSAVVEYPCVIKNASSGFTVSMIQLAICTFAFQA